MKKVSCNSLDVVPNLQVDETVQFNADLSHDDTSGCSSGILQSMAKVTQKLHYSSVRFDSEDEPSLKLAKIETIILDLVFIKFHPKGCHKRKEY